MNSTSTIAHQKTEQTENIESRIIEAAKQEFIKKGFEQTSMSDIAAVVGINRPTLHYYFRTKDKMFQAVFASIVAKFLPHIDTIFLHLDNDKTGRLCTAALKELLQKDYKIVDEPPPVGKDFNDFLLSYLGITRPISSRERSDAR